MHKLFLRSKQRHELRMSNCPDHMGAVLKLCWTNFPHNINKLPFGEGVSLLLHINLPIVDISIYLPPPVLTDQPMGTDYAYRIITAPTPSDFHTFLRYCIGYIASKSSQLEILKTRAHTTSFSKPDTVLIQQLRVLAQVAFFCIL